MTMRKRIVLSVLAAVVFIFGSAMAVSATVGDPLSLDNFKLTTEQINKIGGTVEEYVNKEYAILMDISNKMSQLNNEIMREDRLDTKMKEKRSVGKVNKLIRDISSQNSQLIKLKVEYILKIKNVLTPEQRFLLIHSLEFDDDFFEEAMPEFVELDLMIVPLDLTNDQMKKILRNRTNMEINELKIGLDIELKMLDLEEELLKGDASSANIDKLILGLTDLGTKLIDNKVKYHLKSKDVLTMEQKKMLLHSIMLMN